VSAAAGRSSNGSPVAAFCWRIQPNEGGTFFHDRLLYVCGSGAAPKRAGADRELKMMKSNAHPANGPHREYFADGKLSAQGRFKKGKRHGLWKYYYRNAVLKAVGKYVDGEFEGQWQWWRENGERLQAGAFRDGKQVGRWKRYYDNGQLWDEGVYESGEKVGEWKVYNNAGALKQSKIFKARR
jgi:antitoxin component YwqK of YwqJK toxin-antitoxin module